VEKLQCCCPKCKQKKLGQIDQYNCKMAPTHRIGDLAHETVTPLKYVNIRVANYNSFEL